MPSTPNFAIPYPCSGDTIDCNIFEPFTAAIQDSLDALDVLNEEVLNRPAAHIQAFANGQTFTVNVATNVIFDTVFFDNDSMVDLAVNNDRITIQNPGMYLVAGNLRTGASFTTITSQSNALSLNGTILYRNKESSDNNNLMYIPSAIGLMNCVAGDVIRLVYLWTGTGGPDGSAIGHLMAHRVTR